MSDREIRRERVEALDVGSVDDGPGGPCDARAWPERWRAPGPACPSAGDTAERLCDVMRRLQPAQTVVRRLTRAPRTRLGGRRRATMRVDFGGLVGGDAAPPELSAGGGG